MTMMKTTLVAVAGVALLAGSVGSAAAGPDYKRHSAEQSYKRALEAMVQKSYRRALRGFSGAASLVPKERKYQLAACEAATLATDWDKSRQHCDQAMALVRGTRDQKRVDKMVTLRLTTIAKDRIERADGYRKDFRFDRALPIYIEVAKKMNRPSDWLTLCSVQIDADQLSAAKASCAKVKGKLAGKAKAVMAAGRNRPNDAQRAALAKIADLADATYNEPESAYRKGQEDAKTSGQCLQAVAAAKKVGARADHPVPLEYDWRGYKTKTVRIAGGRTRHVISLGKVGAFCKARYAMAIAAPAMYGLEDAHKRLTALNKGPIDKLTTGNLITLTHAAIDCRKGVDKALAGGATANLVIDVNGVKLQLGQAKAEICGALDAKTAAVKVAIEARKKAELDAKIAPFKKLLKKGKLASFIEYEGWNDDMEILGKGGYRLVTPKDFKKAKKWFMWSASEDRRGRPIWEMRVLKFRGHKLVRTKEKRGRGTEPPRKAFR